MQRETMMVDGPGVRLRVSTEGPAGAPPLLFSNSLGASLEMWDAQAAHFSAFRRVIRYDVRGHGESGAARGPTSLHQLGMDALAILDHFAIAQVDWVGCSMGGMVGQWLLTCHAGRIGKAVLANTAAVMSPPEVDWNARIRMALGGGMDEIADQMKLRWFTRRFNETHPGEVKRVTDMVRRASPGGYAACAAAIRDMDQREAIGRIANKVLVIVGAQDPATTPSMGAVLAERIAGAQRVTLDAAHISNCEQPEAYNAAVGTFLAA